MRVEAEGEGDRIPNRPLGAELEEGGGGLDLTTLRSHRSPNQESDAQPTEHPGTPGKSSWAQGEDREEHTRPLGSCRLPASEGCTQRSHGSWRVSRPRLCPSVYRCALSTSPSRSVLVSLPSAPAM